MTDVRELLDAAHSALETDNRLVARGYFRRATGLAPERKDIWEALLEVSDRPADRERCLEQIVELDPDDTAARAALAALRAEKEESEAGPEESLSTTGQTIAATTAPGDNGQSSASMPTPFLVDARPDVTVEMLRQWDATVAAGASLHCINHPHRETALRCNRCGAPVCTSCVVRTPVGYRCAECVKAQQATFFNAQWYDYPIAGIVSLLLSIPAAAIASIAGWFFAIIVSPVAGGLIGGIVHWAIGRRRGRWTWLVVTVGMVLGALAAMGVTALLRSPSLVSLGIYVFMATGAATSVLRLGKRRG
ncbi:MAG: hypothetical protein ACK2UX_18900 [Anaerolineae bacterium]